MTIDDEWQQFCSMENQFNVKMFTRMVDSTRSTSSSILRRDTGGQNPDACQRLVEECYSKVKQENMIPHTHEINQEAPIISDDDLIISTKTKVLYLNQEIKINEIFWNIPILEYWKPTIGVVKKQIKIVSNTLEEFEEYQRKLTNIPYYTETIKKQINNPDARTIKFKDERKICIGLSKKDIISSRAKQKNAFFNCIAIICRLFVNNIFREYHVKIFNTGKMEIPGVICSTILEELKQMIITIFQPFASFDLQYKEINDNSDHVLINSNFNCKFYIHRQAFHNIISSTKYGLESAYDPCSYPGVKCKFYFNNEIGFSNLSKQHGKILPEDKMMKMSELIESKKYTEVSFMLFRTGSCILVGNCTEQILRYIFSYLRNILIIEYPFIVIQDAIHTMKPKRIRTKKKSIVVTNEFYQDNCLRL